MTANWRTGKLQTNGVTLHYQRTGGDKPPLVLVHGFTDSGRCWTALASALEKTFDVIMPDARGHGLSDKPGSGYLYPDYAADLAGLIDVLGLDKPALLGHSMGAGTAAYLAADRPELVSKIILEDPPWRASGDELDPDQHSWDVDQWLGELRDHKHRSPEALIAFCREQNPRWSLETCTLWAYAKQQLSLDIFEYMRVKPDPWQGIVSRIQCPLLLLTGDPALGAIITSKTAAEAASLWQNGQAVHIANAGHSIRREQFIPYLAAVKAFLQV